MWLLCSSDSFEGNAHRGVDLFVVLRNRLDVTIPPVFLALKLLSGARHLFLVMSRHLSWLSVTGRTHRDLETSASKSLVEVVGRVRDVVASQKWNHARVRSLNRFFNTFINLVFVKTVRLEHERCSVLRAFVD